MVANNPKKSVIRLLPWYFKWFGFFIINTIIAIVVSLIIVLGFPIFAHTIYAPVLTSILGLISGFTWGRLRNKKIKELIQQDVLFIKFQLSVEEGKELPMEAVANG